MSRYALVIDSFCCVIGFQRDEQTEREREGGREVLTLIALTT